MHLTLVRPKVGQGKKKSTCNSAPKGITACGIDAKVQNIQFITCPGNFQGLAKSNVLRQITKYKKECDKHSCHYNKHLLFMCNTHSPGTTRNGINDNKDTY